jgi:hypothetical protein
MVRTPNEPPAEDAPNAPHSAIESEILGEIEKARKKWGETFELKLLLGSWGDTCDDEQMLEALRTFNRTDHGRDEFEQDDEDCGEIVVVPPSGVAFDDPNRLAEIRAGLAKRFPQFVWRVELGPIRDDVAFALIPRPGSTASGRRLREPTADVMKAVSEFLNDNFAPNRRLH